MRIGKRLFAMALLPFMAAAPAGADLTLTGSLTNGGGGSSNAAGLQMDSALNQSVEMAGSGLSLTGGIADQQASLGMCRSLKQGDRAGLAGA